MIDIADGLLSSAEQLLGLEGPHREAHVRRAMSACYYAVFHALAKAFADCLIGDNPNDRPNRAWIEVYRGFDHGPCKDACDLAVKRQVGFPEELLNVATEFGSLQAVRHQADYDPRPLPEKIMGGSYLATARDCVAAIRSVDPVDMRAFATWVLISAKGAKEVRSATHPPASAKTPAPPSKMITAKPKKKKARR